MTRVSVIIPVYNVEKYLEKCLGSLINQSLTDIEFICINDGSTDNSLEILNRYAAKDKRFTVISQENRGQGVARNKGLEVAKGEYIGFVDPDDRVEENMFESLYVKAKDFNLDLIECNYTDYFEDSRPPARWQTRLKTNKIFNWHNNKAYLFTHPIATWNKLFRTELIRENNIKFSNGKCGEDHCFTIPARLLAKRVMLCDEYLYNYLTRENTDTRNLSINNFDIVYFIKSVKDLLIQQNVYQDVKKEFAKYESLYLSLHYKRTPEEKQSEFINYIKTYLSDSEYKLFTKRLTTKHSHFMENLFSIKNDYSNGQKVKVITLFGNNFRRAL